jgi:hypothetical protein
MYFWKQVLKKHDDTVFFLRLHYQAQTLHQTGTPGTLSADSFSFLC